jgi:3',5'-cyclic AMP phosphodiesterase CpdA
VEIVQISDTHFGTELPEVEDALVESLTALAPDILLLAGDVTQRARWSEFSRARAFLDRLAIPEKIVIPGNHDIPLYHLWRRVFSPYQDFKRAFSEVETVRETDDCTIIAVNSTCPMKHKDGMISAEKIDQVAAILERNRHSELKIVAAHHPFAVVLASDRENIVINAEAALEAWCAAGMDVVLGGHIHYPFIAPLRGYYPHLETQAWIVQSGTAVSRRVRNGKPNSFNRVTVAGNRARARIEQWNFQSETGRFEPVESFSPWSHSQQ